MKKDSPLRLRVGRCPICGGEARSPHHILPLNDGGTDEPVNIVLVCQHCHDILEGVYDDNGLQYSPHLVSLIQLANGYPSRIKQRNHYKVLVRKPVSKHISHTAARNWTYCSNCGNKFFRYKKHPDAIYCHNCIEIGLKYLKDRAIYDLERKR